MYRLVQGDSTKYFKDNKIDNVSLVITSPSYFTRESKKDLLEGEIGYGKDVQTYVDLIKEVIIASTESMDQDGKVVLILGRYNDVSIKSIIYMLEDELLNNGFTLSNYSLHGKGDHESIVVFVKGQKQMIQIPTFYKLQIYDKVGYFGRINPEILDWAITQFSAKGELVVDPFAGAGSTVKRADMHGRNGLGIELNPKFIK